MSWTVKGNSWKRPETCGPWTFSETHKPSVVQEYLWSRWDSLKRLDRHLTPIAPVGDRTILCFGRKISRFFDREMAYKKSCRRYFLGNTTNNLLESDWKENTRFTVRVRFEVFSITKGRKKDVIIPIVWIVYFYILRLNLNLKYIYYLLEIIYSEPCMNLNF